jgi:hypothetical protein
MPDGLGRKVTTDREDPMKLRRLLTKGTDGSRWQLWPIRFGWGDRMSSCWFQVHGWEVGCELVPDELTTLGEVPGLRAVVGQTYHLGRLKILFGRHQTQAEQELIDSFARYRQVVALLLKTNARPKDHDGLMRENWALMAEIGKLINRRQTEPLAFAWGVRSN